MENSPVISMNNATIAYGKEVVLSKVNVSIEKGQFLYLVGKTGSGKSTLLKSLYGEVKLSGGSGSVAGFDLLKLKSKQVPFLRRKLGIVFQDFQLLTDRSVMKNLFFVMKATGWKKKKEMEARGLEVLGMVGVEEKAYKMPHELSGGEQQRVAIARALLNNPKLILADEPTGNLDPETSESIMKLLIAIAKEGTSLLMATHDMSLVEKFPGRVLRVEQNTIREVESLNNFNPFETKDLS